MSITVRPLALSDADGCDAIMRGLPDYFGHEGGLAAYREAVRSRAGLVAEEAGTVVGFAVWEPRTAATAEITWMAVERDRRHGGIGTAIVEALAADLAGRGFRLALAMTSGAGGFYMLAAFLFVGYGFLGLVIPTSAVLALEDHGEIAGTASSLMGTLHFVISGLAMVLVSLVFDGEGRLLALSTQTEPGLRARAALAAHLGARP